VTTAGATTADVTAADAVRRLLYTYAERLDAGDLDGVAELFAGATFRSDRRPQGARGTTEVRGIYDDVILYGGVPRTKHLITNVVIEVTGSGTDPIGARSRCAFTVLQAAPGQPLCAVLSGRYHDEFRLGDDSQWRFADRYVHPDFIGDLRHHMRARPQASRS
jgi:3-phenylpropionate/cinnamic acid dioxygenase small subunit